VGSVGYVGLQVRKRIARRRKRIMNDMMDLIQAEQGFFDYFNRRVDEGAVGPLRGGEIALVRLVFGWLRGEQRRVGGDFHGDGSGEGIDMRLIKW